MGKRELVGFGSEENEEFDRELLLQQLLDFDKYMLTNLGMGVGIVGEWVFRNLHLRPEDRGLYLRMVETLKVALDAGGEGYSKLDLKLLDGMFPRLYYNDRKAVVPLIVGGAGKNLEYWIKMPLANPEILGEQRHIYKLGRLGVDGLLEYLGLGCYGNPEKFGTMDNFRHYWEKMKLDNTTTHWWAGFGDRRSFVVTVSHLGRVEPIATHYFQLDGGYWGSRTLPFDEAAQIGQEDQLKVSSGVFRLEEWG